MARIYVRIIPMLRLALLAVATVNLYVAYLFFFTPEVIGVWYTLPPIDNVHRFLTMMLGALLSVFGLGALLAFIRPVRYAAIVIMLLLMHFAVFLIDVIVIARGEMPWDALMPEIIYFLIVSTVLVRWYPLGKKKKVEQQKEPEPEVVEAEVLEQQE